jgi:Rrf2 family protein
MKVITKLIDYAVVICCYLTRCSGCYVSANCVAQEVDVSLPTVMKLLKILAASNVVKAKKGVNGGYMLARDPSDINLTDIIYAASGDSYSDSCFSMHAGCSCNCSKKFRWQMINDEINNVLAKYTLLDMSGFNESGDDVR